MHQRFILIFRHGRQHFITDGGVRFHHRKFFGGQLAGLVQNFIVHRNFANVMQGAGLHDQLTLLHGKPVLIRQQQKRVQQLLGERAHIQQVRPALAVSVFHDVAQNIAHHAVVALFFVDLPADHIHQPALAGIQHDGVVHTAAHDALVKGAGHIVRNAHLVGMANGIVGALARDHDHGRFLQHIAVFHGLQHGKPVHAGHHDVQQHQRYLLGVVVQNFQRLHAAARLDDGIFRLQHIRQQFPVKG